MTERSPRPTVRRRAAAVIALIACTTPAFADPATITIYSENDSPHYKPNNTTDRQYTNGAGGSIDWQPQWARDIAPHMPFAESFGHSEAHHYGAGIVFGQLMYTPDDITIAAPQPSDRPWGGYLFGGLYWQRVKPDRSVMDHIQLDDPQGWDNQLPDEPTFNFQLRRKWRALSDTVDLGLGPMEYEMLPAVGLSLGTRLRQASLGAVGRIGWKLPDDFGPARLLDPGDATATYPDGWSGYLFGRLTGKAVQFDAMLDGTQFNGSPSVDRKPLVGEAQLGLQLAYRAANWHAALGYSQTFRTEQFEQQDGSHAFGAWTLAMSFQF